jgi:tetratricopeptide (TPR) repeat protein
MIIIFINSIIVIFLVNAIDYMNNEYKDIYKAYMLYDEGVSRLGEEPARAEHYFREACTLLEKAVGRESGMTEIRARAAKLFEKVVGRESGVTEIRARAAACHLNIGLIAMRTDRPAMAVTELEHAVAAIESSASQSQSNHSEVSENLVRARGHLAFALASGPDPTRRNLDRAVALARQNTELSPDDADSWGLLGAIALKMGSIQLAINALERSMELRKGGDSHEWFLLASAHALNGDRGKARQYYDRAVLWMEAHQPRDQALLELRSQTAQLLSRSP